MRNVNNFTAKNKNFKDICEKDNPMQFLEFSASRCLINLHLKHLSSQLFLSGLLIDYALISTKKSSDLSMVDINDSNEMGRCFALFAPN